MWKLTSIHDDETSEEANENRNPRAADKRVVATPEVRRVLARHARQSLTAMRTDSPAVAGMDARVNVSLKLKAALASLT